MWEPIEMTNLTDPEDESYQDADAGSPNRVPQNGRIVKRRSGDADQAAGQGAQADEGQSRGDPLPENRAHCHHMMGCLFFRMKRPSKRLLTMMLPLGK